MADQSEQWLNDIRQIVTEHADAKANRVYLEHFRKSKKAMLMREGETQGIKTGTAQEAYAYAHPEYLELLEGLKEAVKVEEYQKWRLRQREWKFEQWRTEQANQRAERARYGA